MADKNKKLFINNVYNFKNCFPDMEIDPDKLDKLADKLLSKNYDLSSKRLAIAMVFHKEFKTRNIPHRTAIKSALYLATRIDNFIYGVTLRIDDPTKRLASKLSPDKLMLVKKAYIDMLIFCIADKKRMSPRREL